VQVVEDQYHRLIGGGLVDQLTDRVEQPQSRFLGRQAATAPRFGQLGKKHCAGGRSTRRTMGASRLS
jgi:hypothetical protein